MPASHVESPCAAFLSTDSGSVVLNLEKETNKRNILFA